MKSNRTPEARSGASPTVERVPAGPILFIDGHCVLCQRAARWVLRHDRRGRVALAALQGKTAHRLLPPALCEVPAARQKEVADADRDAAPARPVPAFPGSLVWREVDGRIRVRSAAVLAVAAALGGWYRAAAALLWLVPAPLRDALYLELARRRRRWFGTTDRCRLPAASHGNRLLD
jgi:predicted DCC family thiol-disulfide oxidoreductase YuxK